MSDLAELYFSLGYTDPRTYIQSGNVVFSHDTGDEVKIAKKIEKRLETQLGLDATVFIRSADELSTLVAENPFAKSESTKLYVTFLYNRPSSVPVDRFNEVKGEGEAFSLGDRGIYLFLPHGSGRTKLSNAFFEKMLKVPATTRNWNTVTALLRMTREASA